MRFSIVTVCFNAEAVIRRAMLSLEEQSFDDYEWIVIDGASTDSTLSILRDFRGDRVRIVSEPDAGIYDAMRKGVDLARGEFLFFLNADDEFVDCDVLGRISERIDVTRPDLLIGRIIHVTDRGSVLRDFAHIGPHSLLIDSVCHQAAFCHRDLFERIGGFDLRYSLASDYDWFIRVFRSEVKVFYSDVTVVRFRGDGAHARLAEKTASEIAAIRRAHAGILGYAFYAIWRYARHFRRRALGERPLGYLVEDAMP